MGGNGARHAQGLECMTHGRGIGFVHVSAVTQRGGLEGDVVYEISETSAVMSVDPRCGTAGGGTLVNSRADLRGFADARCMFWSKAVEGVLVSSALLVCESPSERAAKDGAPSGWLEDESHHHVEDVGYTYVAAASMRKMRPAVGWMRGGTVVRMLGRLEACEKQLGKKRERERIKN